jgi:TonB family protein
VLLDKIQSGFLLLETPQGFARIELSPRQRLYLLWTFRNFRHLSVQLLNLRERELVNSLFHDDVEVMPDVEDSDLVIGVVENFVSPKRGMGASPARKVIPKKVQPKIVIAQPSAIARRPDSVSQPAMPAGPELAMAMTKIERATPEPANARPMAVQPSRTERNRRKLLITRVATAFAALCLCVGSVGAWYRIQGLPVSQANNRQVKAVVANSPNFSEAETRVPSIAPNSTVAPTAATSAATPEVTSEHVTTPEAALESATITTAVPTSIAAHVATELTASSTGARVHDAASTSLRPLSGQDGVIEASRAPLYSVYPDSPEVRVRGAVSLKAGLDSAGKVRSVKLISGNRALATAAIRAVRQWRYRPYLKDGQPVATETYVVISFISDDVVSMSFPSGISATR